MNEESEAPVRKLTGIPGMAAWALAVGLSVYALIWVVTIVQPQVYRVSFLLIALVLTFLLYPARKGQRIIAEYHAVQPCVASAAASPKGSSSRIAAQAR